MFLKMIFSDEKKPTVLILKKIGNLKWAEQSLFCTYIRFELRIKTIFEFLISFIRTILPRLNKTISRNDFFPFKYTEKINFS